MRQENKENVTEYAMRFKEQAETREFRDNREDRILEQLIQTSGDSEIMAKTMEFE